MVSGGTYTVDEIEIIGKKKFAVLPIRAKPDKIATFAFLLPQCHPPPSPPPPLLSFPPPSPFHLQ